MMSAPISVVVADDSPFICGLLSDHLASDGDMRVVGTALNGRDAIELVKKHLPQVVTMDLEMPIMNGLEALDHLMHHHPLPVVVISGLGKKAADATLRALALGAVDFILKYTPGQHTDPTWLQREIVGKVRAAANIRVIRNLPNSSPQPKSLAHLGAHINNRANNDNQIPGGIVVIGASTGGPMALRQMLANLPRHFNAAILVVQHMPANFTAVLAKQLARYSPFPTKEAAQGDLLAPGRILVAPGNRHMLVDATSRIVLSDGPPIKGHRPAISVTMQSVAQTYGPRTTGILLTGMGDDGTLGLLAIRNRRGRTMVQSPASCVVDSMPHSAIQRGVVDHIAAPVELARLLTRHQQPLSKTVNA